MDRMQSILKRPTEGPKLNQLPVIAQPVQVIKDISYAAAKAIVGGRFKGAKEAVKDPEFQRANIEMIKESCEYLRKQDIAVTLCMLEEQQRKKRQLSEIFAFHPENKRTNFDWQEEQFEHLILRHGTSSALNMNDSERSRYAWCFENTSYFDRRHYSWTFMYSVYADLTKRAPGALVMGGSELLALVQHIFGDAAYCVRSISDAVKEDRPEQPIVGRPPSFPREVEAVLFRFISACRRHHIAIYKSTIVNHGQRLLDGTEAALMFVRVVDDEYVTDDEGHLLWDYTKWDNWFYRRFWGDRRADGATTGNQCILDIHRAKWHSFEAMEPYFQTHVQALIDEGICTRNPLCVPAPARIIICEFPCPCPFYVHVHVWQVR